MLYYYGTVRTRLPLRLDKGTMVIDDLLTACAHAQQASMLYGSPPVIVYVWVQYSDKGHGDTEEDHPQSVCLTRDIYPVCVRRVVDCCRDFSEPDMAFLKSHSCASMIPFTQGQSPYLAY